ncbi:hypothetical protein M9H77_13066 [Catharanthus roseus]|uniref:Uncharacterized protein n=1 Tax=Catharanthus roseus TaxID=4058 RepID=A0ACC0BJD0_CATRO|nr:hypothetical protein M9H77_13066 [Catharanthus roseus]
MVKVKNTIIEKEENYEEGGSSRGGRTGKERVSGRDISFDDRILNTILGTPENVIRFYAKNKKCFDPNLYSDRRFEELFTKGEVLKRHDDRNANKVDAFGRLLHHMISNMIIPNVGHKSSITNMHFFVMLALHEHRRMNFGFMANEHMLATQTSSTKIGFSRNEKGILVRGGQESYEEEEEEDDGQDAMNVDEEVSEEELEEETFRREIRQKKRQERDEEGQSSKEQKMHKMSLKGNLQRSKRSLKTIRFSEDEVIKLKTLKTRRMLKDSFKVFI